MKLACLGDAAAAGKRELLRTLCADTVMSASFPVSTRQAGACVGTVSLECGTFVEPGSTLQLEAWLGDEHTVSQQRPFYEDADVVVLAYSVTSMDTFASVHKRWLPELLSELRPSCRGVIIVGLDADNVDERAVPYAQLAELASWYLLPFLEVSTRDGTNVELLKRLLAIMLMSDRPSARTASPSPAPRTITTAAEITPAASCASSWSRGRVPSRTLSACAASGSALAEWSSAAASGLPAEGGAEGGAAGCGSAAPLAQQHGRGASPAPSSSSPAARSAQRARAWPPLATPGAASAAARGRRSQSPAQLGAGGALAGAACTPHSAPSPIHPQPNQLALDAVTAALACATAALSALGSSPPAAAGAGAEAVGGAAAADRVPASSAEARATDTPRPATSAASRPPTATLSLPAGAAPRGPASAAAPAGGSGGPASAPHAPPQAGSPSSLAARSRVSPGGSGAPHLPGGANGGEPQPRAPRGWEPRPSDSPARNAEVARGQPVQSVPPALRARLERIVRAELCAPARAASEASERTAAASSAARDGDDGGRGFRSSAGSSMGGSGCGGSLGTTGGARSADGTQPTGCRAAAGGVGRCSAGPHCAERANGCAHSCAPAAPRACGSSGPSPARRSSAALAEAPAPPPDARASSAHRPGRSAREGVGLLAANGADRPIAGGAGWSARLATSWAPLAALAPPPAAGARAARCADEERREESRAGRREDPTPGAARSPGAGGAPFSEHELATFALWREASDGRAGPEPPPHAAEDVLRRAHAGPRAQAPRPQMAPRRSSAASAAARGEALRGGRNAMCEPARASKSSSSRASVSRIHAEWTQAQRAVAAHPEARAGSRPARRSGA